MLLNRFQSAGWAAAESATLFTSIILFIWWIRPHLPYFWAILLAYVLLSHVVRRESPAHLGFRADTTFPASAIAYGPYALVAGIVLISSGCAFHTIRQISIEWSGINLGLYVVWGLFQQYLLNGYFLNRFSRFTSRAPLLAAICFSLVHTPNWFLMIATLVGGYFAGLVYLRFRNLYFLGLAHGILGFAIYLAVPDSISHHLWVGPGWFRH